MFLLRKLIVKFLCIFIPLKKWRKSFRTYCFSEKNKEDSAIMERIFLEIKSKKISILKSTSEIENLFVGGSQGAYGFIPEYFSDKSFNIASNSQDSFTCFSLFNVLRKKLPKLKTVFVRYGVFSSGFNISKSNFNKQLAFYYKYLFNINYPIEDYKKNFIKVTKKFDKLPLFPDNNGYIDSGTPMHIFDAKSRAEHHLKEHNREIKQDKWIVKLNNLAKQHNIELVVVIFPCRADYKSYLPSSDILFKDIYEICKDIKIINFYGDKDFTDEDFYDTYHLNPQGAIKFTKKLKEMYHD